LEGQRKKGDLKRARPQDGLSFPSVAQNLLLDAQAGLDSITKFSASTWWSWEKGSTLAHWRWPEGEQRIAARDGMPAYFLSVPPSYFPTRRVTKPEIFELLLPKLQRVIERGYVVTNQDPQSIPDCQDFVRSLIDYFGVPKEKDIRLVYNGTSSGLNKSVWAPNFWLPTPRTASRSLNFNYCGVDVDMGDFFLNFPLPKEFRRFSGINISEFQSRLGFGHLSMEQLQVRWERCWMGFRPSPYYAVRFYYWGEEFARGDPREQTNPMRWDEVRLNLPGDPRWSPSLPRVMKWDQSVNNIASEVTAFVDDLRFSGWSEEQTWQSAHVFVSRLQYLGMQDAPRKRRPPFRKTGAWAGAIFNTLNERITQTVSLEKWLKAKSYIEVILGDLSITEKAVTFEFKFLERVRGFLCHLSMTFEVIVPFLKGFHMSLCSHLPYRDGEGWKLSERAWEAYVHQQEESGDMDPDEASAARAPPRYEDIPTPKRVTPVPRFQNDIKALSRLFELAEPPEVVLRSNKVIEIMYGFGDASGKGFGSTLLSSGGIKYRIGLWSRDAEEDSSNWRELGNLVEALEEEGATGSLDGAAVFFFTDNTTAEAALYKGNSSSQKLFDLVLRMKSLEMEKGCRVVVSHVSGERMKAQGTDGVSRGQLKEGVPSGASMLSFIPTDRDPLDRSPKLREWLSSWGGKELEFLTPEDWFERGHDHRGGQVDSKGFWHPNIKMGTYLWSPPPGAAEVALEELRRARIKRQSSTHIFICPRLLTPEWRRQLHKAADIVFEVPPGPDFWPPSMFEPLIVGIVFPFIHRAPWQLRGTPKMFQMVREMRKVFAEEVLASGNILRKFLLECRRLSTVPSHVVRAVLYFEHGDHLPDRSTPKRQRNH
jgi:hypothetical protein